ncbi:response regulator transcription factor [Kribbella sp.]|uniref:response regulator transcription factor n=1 Tax=Kribbella sp. TaxID=1871183 RepID=UPI002D5A87E2|nr:response regulator transcription factor [Kribbella sp.]HZX06760.1 response regulator transcription factor [Kribbella sp.]
MIRVALVDDHPVVRFGVRSLVDGQDDLTVVGEAADAHSAEQLVAAVHPDVVLMDLNLGPGPGGAEATARLRALPEPPYVLILTTYDTEADIMGAIDAGASGYLLKDAPPEDLFRAIRGTARGETVLAPVVAARLVRRTGPTLTEREVEILGLLATGKSNREMAKRLYVSEATVKSHLQHIYTKLEVETRVAAVARAIEQRIIRAVS